MTPSDSSKPSPSPSPSSISSQDSGMGTDERNSNLTQGPSAPHPVGDRKFKGSLRPSPIWKDFFRSSGASQKTLASVLKENVLFSTLSYREIKYLTTLVYERIYQPNEPIFNQNDRGLGVYLIAKGRVGIVSQTPEGEVPVVTLTEGSFFGEIALVEPDNLRSASAISLERSIVVGFFKPDLLELLERKPAMGVKILLKLASVLGKRLHETTEHMAKIVRRPERRERLEKVS